jgi:hypothetical protein
MFTWSARVEAVEDEDDLFATEIVVTDGRVVLPIRGMLHRSGATIVAGAAP